MALTPSDEVVPNFGMGLITYLCDETELLRVPGQSQETALEDLAKFGLGTKLYVRLNWKDIQQHPGRLEPNAIWKTSLALAKQYGKRLAFRVMISNPVLPATRSRSSCGQKCRCASLVRGRTASARSLAATIPAFMQQHFGNCRIYLALGLYDGRPDIEYVDTCMYGFWGEGHTWPLEKNPYPDYVTAEATFVRMLDEQMSTMEENSISYQHPAGFQQGRKFGIGGPHGA